MRYAIVGAGATGGFLGACLARAGEDVTLIARGEHLAAMRQRGVQVKDTAGDFVVRPSCTDDLAAVAEADAVLLTVKAHALPGLAPLVAPHLRPGSVVVTAQNGIPWWYFERHGGELEGTRLRAVDPDGTITAAIDARQLVGGVVWFATRLVAPGVVEHVEGSRISLGELDGERTKRCQAIAAALSRAGLKCPVSRRIRHDVWVKLWGNVAFNPLSALTRATMSEMASDPETQTILRAVMAEAERVAAALGIKLPITIDQRFAGAEGVGDHKTSMLQDVEARRPLEIDAVAGAVVELGDLLGVPVPHLRTAYACVKLLEQALLRYSPPMNSYILSAAPGSASCAKSG